MSDKKSLWESFCQRHKIMETGVPLFQVNSDMFVETFTFGKDHRRLLRRSHAMDQLVIGEAAKVIQDYHSGNNHHEGLIYMMFWKVAGEVVPLYIGKAGKYGINGKTLSANIKGVDKDPTKFCRWGYSYYYHMGDLSAAVCIGHEPSKVTDKYAKWAKMLFNSAPSEQPELKEQTYFWICAWKHGSVGPWKEYGSTSLVFLEYLLIALASDLYPSYVLNSIGVNHNK